MFEGSVIEEKRDYVTLSLPALQQTAARPTRSWKRICRRWKQLHRLQRVVLWMLGFALLIGLIYAVASRTESHTEASHSVESHAATSLESNVTPPPLPPNPVIDPEEGEDNAQNPEEEEKKGGDQIIPPPELPVKKKCQARSCNICYEACLEGLQSICMGARSPQAYFKIARGLAAPGSDSY